MNKYLFLIIFLTLIITICCYDFLSNQNKFRVNMLFEGFLNKLILLLIIVLITIENIQLGILFILGFFILNIRILNNKNNIQEGFTEYFENYSL